MPDKKSGFFSFFNISWVLFGLLFITPIPAFYRTWINAAIHDLFLEPINFLIHILAPKFAVYPAFYTDSLGYIFLLIFTALLMSTIWMLLRFLFPQKIQFLQNLSNYTLLYYVSWVFLLYAFSKVFHGQFADVSSIPKQWDEQFGELGFWRFMSHNPALVYATALVEFITAIALLFSATRRWGILLACISSGVIFGLNLYFDISVKVFAGLLLFSSIVLYLKYIDGGVEIKTSNKSLRIALKFFVIACLILTAYY